MTQTKGLYAKAQSQLLDILQAASDDSGKGWDKDPDWVNRDKGRFSSKGGTSQAKPEGESKFPGQDEYVKNISRIEGLAKKDIDQLQKAYELLSPQDMKDYEAFANSPEVKQMQEDFSSAMQSVSTDAAKVYNDVIKKVKNEPEPKEQLNAIQQAIKDHPETAKTGAAVLGVVALTALGFGALSGMFGVFGVIGVLASKAAAKSSLPEGLAKAAAESGEVSALATKIHALNVVRNTLEGGTFGLAGIALAKEVDKNEKEQAAKRFGNQLDSKAFAGGEKQKQDFAKEIVEAVDKASKDFNKEIQK